MNSILKSFYSDILKALQANTITQVLDNDIHKKPNSPNYQVIDLFKP